MKPNQLKNKLERAPKRPGIYIFKNRDRFLYIGKAVSIQSRLKGYVRPLDQRLEKMLSLATTLSFKVTPSDIEAMILESQLIKKYRPQFNIMLRDDKQYFFVAFSKNDFPRIQLTHQPEATDSIGPFTDGTALKTTLKYLRKIFPYCTCKQQHNNYCLNYHLANCPGFCCLKEKANAKNLRLYQKNIKALKDILLGKKNSVIKNIKKEMIGLARKERFAEAINLRTKLEKIEKIFQNALIIQKKPLVKTRLGFKLSKELGFNKKIDRIEGYDISNIQGKNAVGSMVVFVDGQPDKNQYRKFKIKTVYSANDTAMLQEILIRRLNHPEWPAPDLVIMDGGKAQLNVARAILPNNIALIALTKDKTHRGSHIYLSTTAKQMKLSTLSQDVKNLILNIDAEAHRFAISYHHKLRRKI
jgi:excinuclease ABC subunit C